MTDYTQCFYIAGINHGVYEHEINTERVWGTFPFYDYFTEKPVWVFVQRKDL